MITKTIKLDINKKLYEPIKAKQGDTKSRFILFNLYDGSLQFDLTNRTVRVYCKKKDNKVVFNDLVINDAKKGYCTLELTNQVLAVSGAVELELFIFEGSKRLSTIPFQLDVIASNYNEDAIVSTNEFTALMNGLASLSEYDIYKNNAKQVPAIKEDIEAIKSQISNINVKGGNSIYYPNVVYNSSFGRFDENLKPDSWETTGIVTTIEHLVGEYSLKLESGEYMKIKDKPIQAFKWEDKSTSFIFRAIGNGTIKVQVLADEVKQEIFSYINNVYTSQNEFTFNINSTNWFNSKYAVELHKCRKTVVLKIECITGNVYIDAVQVAPIEQGFLKTEIPYIDGPMCFNDVMQFRTTDLVNAKVGDMWFRSDL